MVGSPLHLGQVFGLDCHGVSSNLFIVCTNI